MLKTSLVPLMLNQSRCFAAAAAAAATANVKVPIQLFGVDGRYATALYTAASKKNQLDAVESELVKFQAAIAKSGKLTDYVRNPVIKRTEKSRAMSTVGRELKFSESTSNFLVLLAENGRLINLKNIVGSFQTLMAAHRGEITCEIVSATELDSEQEKKLREVLKSFAPNKTIKLVKKVNPELMGGMTVLIGDRYVDMSTVSKVKKYTTLLRTPV